MATEISLNRWKVEGETGAARMGVGGHPAELGPVKRAASLAHTKAGVKEMS